MSTSPFHGIFSSFGQDAETADIPGVSAAAAYEAVEEEATITPASSSRSQTGQIAVDIFEQDNYYIIRAPIAGVKMSDIDIEVDDKVITIRGVRRSSDAVADNQFYLQECFWGEFSRSVTLPCSIDPKKVKATFSKDSVLKVLVPKEERIKIVRVSEGS